MVRNPETGEIVGEAVSKHDVKKSRQSMLRGYLVGLLTLTLAGVATIDRAPKKAARADAAMEDFFQKDIPEDELHGAIEGAIGDVQIQFGDAMPPFADKEYLREKAEYIANELVHARVEGEEEQLRLYREGKDVSVTSDGGHIIFRGERSNDAEGNIEYHFTNSNDVFSPVTIGSEAALRIFLRECSDTMGDIQILLHNKKENTPVDARVFELFDGKMMFLHLREEKEKE